MKPLHVLTALCALLTALFAAAPGRADTATQPFLSPLFTDSMVLQRGMADPIWGWTAPGQTVSVSTNGKTSKATADSQGRWQTKIGPLPTGGPYTITISGPETVTLKDVLVGDVWICSGQSNMEFGIGNGNNATEEIAQANYPQIRLYTVKRDIAVRPQPTPTGQWEVCTPENIAQDGIWNGFSAVAYFFGRDLNQKLHVPIGLIHTSWGGTPAEAWTSASALQASSSDYNSGIGAVASDNILGKTSDDPNRATVLYNGMIAPLIPSGIKGAIWYQGESNAGRAYQYRKLLPTMITDWRQRWGEGNFPFLIVQLANYQATQPDPGDDAWAELREAQLMTSQTLPNTGMAVIIDIGDANDIHPKDKQDVGHRLALAALKIGYGQKIEDAGPIYKSMKVEGSAIRLSFTDIGGGLTSSRIPGGFTAQGAKLTGFAIAGDDHKWVWADATIDKDNVTVSSPAVAHPVAVRYAWATNPVCDLYNKDGLPATPFRTDTWPGVTVNNK